MGRDPKNPVFQFLPISEVLVLELMSPEFDCKTCVYCVRL